jgi:Tfp pilus assembly protein PilV
MVYVLVAVLIAAICVLAVLLFSGESPRRTGANSYQPTVSSARP